MKDLGLQSSQVIFIDDQLNNVEAARNLGIDAVHFTSTQELREALVQKHILHD